MKQNSGDSRCVAIVAALATGTDPKLFEKRFKHKPPFSELEFATYLFERGLACNLGFGPDYFREELSVGDSENPDDKLYIPKADLTPETVMNLQFKVKDLPAMLIVESGNGHDKGHMIYWDTQQIFDPNPMSRNGRPFSDYKILKYFPIINLKAH